jgi:hypothetical protein
VFCSSKESLYEIQYPLSAETVFISLEEISPKPVATSTIFDEHAIQQSVSPQGKRKTAKKSSRTLIPNAQRLSAKVKASK